MVAAVEAGAGAAPKGKLDPVRWLKENLFSTWYNIVLTIIALLIVYYVAAALWQWGIADAVWVAEDRRECLTKNPNGACWAGVFVWFEAFIYGRYPLTERWRINLGAILLVLWMAPLWLPRVRAKILIAFSVVAFYPFFAAYLFNGGEKGFVVQPMISIALVCFAGVIIHSIIGVTSGGSIEETAIRILGLADKPEKTRRNILLGLVVAAIGIVFVAQMSWTLPAVSWVKWGGLFLTLVIAGVGITTALPAGIILALGRRSQLPVIRALCTTFIEVFRSVPLITVLFMATTMFPLFLPPGFELNKLVQVIVAVCLFSACYMAEIVRGGLQAIPRGQYEAAHAMGLGYWRMMAFVVMPQALKFMIANIVGNFIGLLKDTTLVAIIGLFDILRMLQAASQDVPWRGLHKEPLFVGAVIFFVMCFSMSKYSQHLERKLSAGDQR